jgi:hypothetical protein
VIEIVRPARSVVPPDMSTRWIAVIALAAGCGTASEPARPSPSPATSAPACEPPFRELAPGCDGPEVVRCTPGAPPPSIGVWCGCMGVTLLSASAGPPPGERYRAQGSCSTTGWELAVMYLDPQGDQPRTTVTLRHGASGETREVGTYPGHCAPSPTTTATLACWYAGAGTELYLDRRGAEVVVSKVDLAEQIAPSPKHEVLRVPAGSSTIGG